MIQFENVTKTFAGGKVKAVDGLDMKIEEGKVFGFIGPNGAGKTHHHQAAYRHPFARQRACYA